MNRSHRNPKEKEKTAFWLLNPASKLESLLLSLFFLLLPTQLGKHFWPDFTLVSGIRIDYLSPTIYTTDIILLLLLACFLSRLLKSFKSEKLRTKSEKQKINPSTPLWIKNKKYILFLVLSFSFLVYNITLSARPLLSVYGFVKLIECTLLAYYLAQTIRSKFQLRQIALFFSFSAVLESLLAIAQYLNQGSINGILYFLGERTFTGTTPGIANASINGTLILRPYATFPHPNVLAGYLLVSIVLVWSLVLKSTKRRIQILGAISLLLSNIALLLTFSRVSILLWGSFIVVLFARLMIKKLKTRKAKLVLMGIGIVLLLFISLLPLSHEVFSRFAQTSLSDESVLERTELLSTSWIMFQHHPIFGVGLDNFIPALAPLQKPLPLNLYLQPVHNIFALVAAETGVFGLGFFCLFLIRMVVNITYKASSIKEPFLVLVLIILVTGFFDHYWLTLQQGQLLFSTVIGLSWTKIRG